MTKTGICPACGDEIEDSEDELGRIYQCANMTCLEFWDASEIEEPVVEDAGHRPYGSSLTGGALSVIAGVI